MKTTQPMKILHSLAAGLLSSTSTLTRRVAFPLLFGTGLLLVQPCSADSGVFSGTGSLVTARNTHTATLLPNGKVLVAGGFNITSNGTVANTELYDPASGSWTATGHLVTGRYLHTATLLPNGHVLVAGGSGSDNLASAELYDPATGAWTATGNLAIAHYFHTATLLPNGKVLVTGGYNNNLGSLASSELYDPASGTWTATGSLVTPRLRHTATLLPNGKVLVEGGVNNTNTSLASAELYDPASGTWTTTGSLATARFFNTATLLPNGKVLVAGGYDGSNADLASGELYDPASGTWTATGSLATARGGHTETLLSNGKVLVAGGVNDVSHSFFASAELYDPANGTWTTTGSLATARALHTATLLLNDNVLMAGGYNNAGISLASAELYVGDAGQNPSQLLNIATRLKVLNGDNVLIGGFIITGTAPKRVIILGIGPSLAQFFSGTLSNPTLELHQGDTLLQTNDDWKTDHQAEVEATGLAPTNDLESAIVRTLEPGSYTAILRGNDGASGIGVVQAYDLNQAANSKFGNIATRGFVDSGDNAMFGGFIIGPTNGESATVVVRAIGPSLTNFGVNGALPDPTIELHDGNGAIIAFNDNWADDANQGSIPQSLKPGDPHESALYRVLSPGDYTAIMRGTGNSTGIGLVEVYNLQ